MPLSLILPCPPEAGWELIRRQELPRAADDGLPLGGFSAIAYQPEADRFWLLSDAPQGHLVPFGGVARWIRSGTPLQLGTRLLLRDGGGEPLPKRFDGEGLVLRGDQAWIVSEGRRSKRWQGQRPPQLLRFSMADGRLQQEVALPAAWRFAPGRGLESNKGPEALSSDPDGGLLLGAEAPLRQDRTQGDVDVVRLARRAPDGQMQELGRLSIGPAGSASLRSQGLTELLTLKQPRGLLALLRSYVPPSAWTAQLQWLPWPAGPAAPPLRPVAGWDLLASGLPPDNWEGMTWGPRLADGRRALVLVSDDNFNPAQRSWVAVLAPRRTAACSAVALPPVSSF